MRTTLRECLSVAEKSNGLSWQKWPEEKTKVGTIQYAPAQNGHGTVIKFADERDRPWEKEVDASYLNSDGELLLFDVTTSQKVLNEKISENHEGLRYQMLLQEFERHAVPAHISHVVITRPFQRIYSPMPVYPCSIHPWPIHPYIKTIATHIQCLLHPPQHD